MTYKNDWYLSWKLCLWHRLQKLAWGWGWKNSLLQFFARNQLLKLVHFPFRSVLPFCGISVHVWKWCISVTISCRICCSPLTRKTLSWKLLTSVLPVWSPARVRMGWGHPVSPSSTPRQKSWTNQGSPLDRPFTAAANQRPPLPPMPSNHRQMDTTKAVTCGASESYWWVQN